MAEERAASSSEHSDPKDMSEEELWELINDSRHRISLGVRPCVLIPYLRQARVLTEMDEDEILSSHQLSNRSMRTSYMLDLLRTQGRNGAMALLESLMIHHPALYTQVTGLQPSIEPSGFSGLIKYSELTEYLVRAVTGMQKELQGARQEACRHGQRCSALEAELGQVMKESEDSCRLRAQQECSRRQLASARREVARLKDEKCDLYVRYTAAIEEKASVNLRSRDLNLKVYQLEIELRKSQTEADFERKRSLKCPSLGETQQLREELQTLRRRLLEAEKFAPSREEILAQDLAEAIDGRTELADHLRRYREENERLAKEREELLKQKECLSLETQKMSLDCAMFQQKSSVMQSQMRELQMERDHAYLSRDEAQAQIARSLGEKDTLRSQLVELQERVFSPPDLGPPERTPGAERFSWGSQGSSSDDPHLGSPARPTLCRMDALNPSSFNSFNVECDETAPQNISLRSRHAEPPSPESLRRREELLYADHSLETDSLLDHEFVFLSNENDIEQAPSSPATPPFKTTNGLSRPSAPPFLLRSRPRAMRITGRALTISFQGEALLSQLQVVGGNKTGVFVHAVTESSAAHTVGIGQGAQILEVRYEQAQQALRMVLEDSTLEEALWALGQVQGFCHLTLRPNQDAYERLLQQMKSSGALSGDSLSGDSLSGDSFYVRVNMSLPGGSGGALAVSCNDILHVTNTRPAGTSSIWLASHVHPCQLLDLQGGTLPNYYRAQRLLIRAIEDMSFQPTTRSKAERVMAREKQKVVRIVSTGRQGRNPLWVSVEDNNDKNADEGDACAPRGCVTLMPYTLVTPHYPPVCRPVLLLPSILGRLLDSRVAEWPGFQLCKPELLSSSERATRIQRSEMLEECEPGSNRCYTLQSVERVVKQGIHCVLPLGLDCVRRLHRAEIFPIIIFIAQTERTARKLKSKLARQRWSEEKLLECCRSEEPLLDKLPCLYRSVPADSWCDNAALLAGLRTLIWEEQKKIVWVEPDLW
ncbi:LOW QUALITY PROTEIN: caspase recruitment domain-containing protein 14 [Hypomesus transpacificus]|uniref:LOW QUALITY PROTEIN: caspase recruitment domain-containing protein 14 n=1 Tax=Hypomesus transpacificus TaxID=137520 RepID=UPI001F072AC8|nr:LOW QUALITY PROTEIN: caspase recruitment domain-containing protein 14 [Hypomesus transpacificus]